MKKAYLDALANNHRYAREEGIDQIMKAQQLDALVACSYLVAWHGSLTSSTGTIQVPAFPHRPQWQVIRISTVPGWRGCMHCRSGYPSSGSAYSRGDGLIFGSPMPTSRGNAPAPPAAF